MGKAYNQEGKHTIFFEGKNINEPVRRIGHLDMSIYKCITENYITSEVVVTEKQLIHIKERHPETHDITMHDIENVLNQPDYIFRDKRPNTGLVVKRIISSGVHILLVLRICTSLEERYKNSIITTWEVSEARLKNYLRNKPILYKNESICYNLDIDKKTVI